jgi:hypothetical protein
MIIKSQDCGPIPKQIHSLMFISKVIITLLKKGR